MKKFILGFATFSLALVSAAESHRVTLYSNAIVNGKELKAGDYKLELDGTRATLKKGKDVVEANVRLESADQKFGTTAVRFLNGDGKYTVNEIRLGGTKTRVVFENPGAMKAAE